MFARGVAMATRGGGVLMPKPRQERLSRAAHLTETEKMQLALCYQALPTYPPGTLNAWQEDGCHRAGDQ